MTNIARFTRSLLAGSSDFELRLVSIDLFCNDTRNGI